VSILEPPRILMVCLGNICRSPLAEGILKYKAENSGIAVTVDSAGIGDWHIGEPPHHLSQKVAFQFNIDISGLRARQFRPQDCQEFDKIYFMDANNMRDAKRMAGNNWEEEKVALLLDVLGQNGLRGVSDPYFGGFDGYIEVFNMISKACDKILEEINSNHQQA